MDDSEDLDMWDYREPDPELDQLVHEIVDVCFRVHVVLGPGLPESHYEEAVAIELRKRKIPFYRRPRVKVFYDGQEIGECELDFLIDKRLVLELKSIEAIAPVHKAQTLTYCKITNCRLGLLVNFNVELIKQGIQRIINPYHKR